MTCNYTKSTYVAAMATQARRNWSLNTLNDVYDQINAVISVSYFPRSSERYGESLAKHPSRFVHHSVDYNVIVHHIDFVCRCR